ncbi:contractile injection system protein, VgrG/Pvc8 family [Arhodomonas aquaeolei]|uniref:phage late control D family protein n=1 Tax=Arhodomonas aquaeolei TaxID=2369 RepID=UPI002167C20B|nr:contractile injection system protein, VgrG/Pvc8 family [Arhodomonas aquaeolei]MCS4503907.1 contractile injection system protein, VgrG/Pvc8 family [Arhodomonas aquaeolei]
MRKPFFKITSDAGNITDSLLEALTELRVEDRSGVHSDALELELADNDKFAWPTEGAELKVEFGYEDRKRERSRFVIDQIEHTGPPPAFTVSATSADFTSQARAKRERSWTEAGLTLGDLVSRIASEHGYEAKVQPQGLADVNLQHVDQAGQSDLALVADLAKQYGAVFKPVDGVWWVRSYDAIGEPVATIRPGDVATWRAHFVGRSRLASVVAHYQDYDLATRVAVTAGEGEPQKTMDRTFVDEPTALANAKAELGRARREARRLTLQMPGRPDLSSQRVIALAGFRDRVDGNWLVTQVTHTINKRGYRCRVQCEGI